jgi:hypothetical protein
MGNPKKRSGNVLDIEETIRPFHPLFRPKEGDSLEDFSPPTDFESYFMSIARSGGPNGPEEAPREYTLAEIPNRETLVAMFGGGRYELEARTAKGQFYARRWLNIDAPMKPFFLQPPKEEGASQQQPAGDLGALAGLAGAPGGGNLFAMANGNPMAILLLVLMQNAQTAEARAERQAAIQAQSSVEMFKALAMMMGGRSGTDPAIASVFASMTDLVKSERVAAAEATARASQQLVPPRTFEEEIERAAKMVSMLRKLDPKAKEESLGDIIKEIAPYLQPFIPQILGAGGTMANGALAEGAAEVANEVAVGSMG